MPYVVAQSIRNPLAFLRFDGSGVRPTVPGGVVNCQYGFGGWEVLYLEQFTQSGRPACMIGSTAFPGLWLRADGALVDKERPTGGVVDLTYTRDQKTTFLAGYDPETGGSFFELFASPGVFLRMRSGQVDRFDVNGSGSVVCQYGRTQDGQTLTSELIRTIDVSGGWTIPAG